MAIRIEMNAETLAAVIGGDSDVELNIRKAIVHEFAKRHLQAVAEAETVKLAELEVRSIANEVACQFFGSTQIKERIAKDWGHFIESLIIQRFEALLKQRLTQWEEELLEKSRKHLRDDVNRLVYRERQKVLADLGKDI